MSQMPTNPLNDEELKLAMELAKARTGFETMLTHYMQNPKEPCWPRSIRQAIKNLELRGEL